MQFCPDPGYQPIGGQPMGSPGIPGAWPLNEPSSYHSNNAVSYGDNESLFEGWVDGEPGTASGIYNLIDNGDGYILSDFTLHCTNENPTTVCASECTKTLSRSDSVILAKYASSCIGIHCTICKGSSSQLRNPEWMLDSGTSAHFTPVFSDFITFTWFKEPLRVNTASSPLALYGFSTVLLQYLIYSKKGKETIKTLHIHDVLFVPHITQRILSLGDFLNQGMCIYGDLHCITLILPESNTPVFQCGPLNSSEKLFWLRASSVTPTSLNLFYKEDYELMHCRMGHPSKDVMCHALQNTKGFPKLNFPKSKPLCPGCAQGKMPQKAFLPSSSWASAPFVKIHSDLKQFPVESYHHHKYFISFVDDYSGFSLITLSRQKSSAINALKDFLAMVLNQYGRTIKEWMSDAGGEYKSDAFLGVLKAKGIKILQSVPFTPQQNGCAEQFNRTIMDKESAMRIEACFPQSWWEFSVEHAMHCYNRTPVKHLNWCTPFEAITGEKPDISRMRVFGCGVYVYIPPTRRHKKLSPKSELMVFLGETEGMKGYHFMCSGNVIFHATQALFDEEFYPRCKTQSRHSTTRVDKPRADQPPLNNEDVPPETPGPVVPWDNFGNEMPPSMPSLPNCSSHSTCTTCAACTCS